MSVCMCVCACVLGEYWVHSLKFMLPNVAVASQAFYVLFALDAMLLNGFVFGICCILGLYLCFHAELYWHQAAASSRRCRLHTHTINSQDDESRLCTHILCVRCVYPGKLAFHTNANIFLSILCVHFTPYKTVEENCYTSNRIITFGSGLFGSVTFGQNPKIENIWTVQLWVFVAFDVGFSAFKWSQETFRKHFFCIQNNIWKINRFFCVLIDQTLVSASILIIS